MLKTGYLPEFPEPTLKRDFFVPYKATNEVGRAYQFRTFKYNERISKSF